MRQVERIMLALAVMGFAGAVRAADSNDAILQRLAELEKLVQAQQAEIADLKAGLSRQQAGDRMAGGGAPVSEDRIEQSALAQLKDSMPLLSLGKNTNHLTIKGDARVRYELDNRDGDAEGGVADRDRERFRHRIRLGGVWVNDSENLEIGLGIEAGSTAGDSGNHTWNNQRSGAGLWDNGSLYLDYGYIKWKWDAASLTLGQQKNPFVANTVLFDGDYRPTGATLQYQGKDGPLFVTLGGYNMISDTDVNADGDREVANMFGLQVGGRFEGESSEGILALAYYDGDDRLSESRFGPGMDSWTYQVVDVYGDFGVDIGDAAAVKVYGEYAKNLGADNPQTLLSYVPAGYTADDGDDAWVLGLQGTFGPFKAKYAYAEIGGDSLLWGNSDFGDGLNDAFLNAQGHVLGLGYKVSKNVELAFTALLTEPIETDAGNDDMGADVYQFDVNVKF